MSGLDRGAAVLTRAPSGETLAAFRADVGVIGAGPVGLVTALELSARGLRVLVMENGGASRRFAQGLSEDEIVRGDVHHAPESTVARQLGGTSNLWGGRCVPLDHADFAPRPWLGELPAWPIRPDELAPWLASACAYLDAGEPVFQAGLPGVVADPGFSYTALERWSGRHRIHKLHERVIARRSNLMVALGITALGFDYDGDGRVAAVSAHVDGRGAVRVALPEVVLAAGGNESTRLLLSEQRRRPDLFGGVGGPLGRHYMGHLQGRIADIAFACTTLHDGMDFFWDARGGYVRRRLTADLATQEAERLTNIAFFPVVPRPADPSHRSGPLSAAYLALSAELFGRRLMPDATRRQVLGEMPPQRWAHARNIARDPVRTVITVPRHLWRTRLARRRMPGLFLRNSARRYGLKYHAEHLPQADSRLTLSDGLDPLGLPGLRIDLRFSDADAAAVVRGHDALGAWLTRNGLGRLDYHVPLDERAAAVLAEARHGTHQIGTIRMGADRDSAVVDRDCRTFDVENLHVISTAVLPTSSQAGPTLTAVQLGLRLADRLASCRSGVAAVTG